MSTKTYIYKLRYKYQFWYRSFLWCALLILAWLIWGFILSLPVINDIFPGSIKVLDKGNTLGYLSAVLAIQIPLFILFLEKMANSGYIYRKLLPRVVSFREIITLLLVGSTLILVSPRESFLYFPVLLLFWLNIIAIYRALTTVFQPDLFDTQINDFLKQSVNKSFDKMLEHRKQHNEFYKQLEELETVKRSFLKARPDDDLINLEIRSEKSGFINNIDLATIVRIRDKEFNIIGETKDTSQQNRKSLAIVVNLNVSPTNSIKRDRTLMTISIPKDYSNTAKLRKPLVKCFEILPQSDIDVRWLEELLGEFDQQLNKAILSSDTILINQTFTQLQVVLDSVDDFIKSKQEDDYKLGQAFEEISRFAGDELSTGLEKMFEILSDLTAKSVRYDQPDINREIIRFIYGNSLNCIHSKNITSIARYDRLLINAISLFVYSNAWNKNLSTTQRDLRESLLSRLKEHTDILVYELKELKEDITKSDDGTLELWFERRLSDIRSLTLASFSNKLDVPFMKFVEILERVERDRHYDRLELDTYSLIKCNILIIAAYIHNKGELNGEFGKLIVNIISRWSEHELTRTFLECTDNDYADKWHVNTRDLLADGEMHSVPSYDLVLKSLWVEIMLGKTIHQNTDIYGEEKLFEQTLFFSNATSSNENNPLLNIVAEKDPENTTKLKDLIEKLIEIRHNWENTKLIDEDIDDEKVVKLRENVNKAYIEASLAEKLFGKELIKSDESRKEKGFMQSGINQVFDKEAFIKDWHIGYGNEFMGEQLGSQIATNQDRNILSNLASKPVTRKDIAKLLTKLSLMDGRKWLVVAVGMGIWSIEHRYKNFVTMADGGNELYFKSIDQILPVQTIYMDGLHEGLYFIDAGKIGTLTVKSDNYDPPVKVEVTAYSKSDYLMDGLISTSPKWLTDKGDEAAQRAYLGTKARLLVERVFKHTAPKKTVVYFLKSDDDII